MSKGTEGHFDTLPIGRLGLIPAIFNINEPLIFRSGTDPAEQQRRTWKKGRRLSGQLEKGTRQ